MQVLIIHSLTGLAGLLTVEGMSSPPVVDLTGLELTAVGSIRCVEPGGSGAG